MPANNLNSSGKQCALMYCKYLSRLGISCFSEATTEAWLGPPHGQYKDPQPLFVFWYRVIMLDFPRAAVLYRNPDTVVEARNLAWKNNDAMSISSITDSARSEADSLSFTDAAIADKSPIDMSTYPAAISAPLFWHISCDFTTRELVKLQRVCKSWKTLVSNHIPIAAKTRWEDDTKDWYFPLRFQIHRDICKRTPSTTSWFCSCGSAWTGSWTWSGNHHSSGEIHSLPPVPSGGGFETHFDWLIASAGGLLLFMDKLPPKEDEFDQPIASRLSEGASAAWLRQDRASFCSIDQVWRPLLVCNPLTKEWRILPAADPRDLGRTAWGYVGIRAHMVADEKANAYKVILTFRNFLLVYKSTSNCWTCRAFPEPTPWGFAPFFPFSREFSLGPSAIVGGKLYFAALEVAGNSTPLEGANDMDIRTFGCVKVYEIDEQAGIWKPPVRYELRNYIPKHLRLYFHLDLGFRLGSYAIGIVECMGSMYAVIPASLNVYATMDAECRRGNDLNDQGPDRHYYQYGYLPLQFYVLQLRGGADLALGRLLMQIPYIGGGNHAALSEYSRRMESMGDYDTGDYMCINPHKVPTKISTWFRCTARGSVIWVTFLDYLLKYDVVSGQSKTQILPDLSFVPPPDLSYRPSFHMKP